MTTTIRKDSSLEKAMLGSVLADNSALATIRAILSSADLFEPAHAVVLESMILLERKGLRIDRVSLAAELSAAQRFNTVGGDGLLDELEFHGLGALAVETYARQVADLAEARRIERFVREMTLRVLDDTVGLGELREAFTKGATAVTVARRDVGKPASMAEAADAFFEDLQARKAKGPGIAGMSTGLFSVDVLISGYERGCLYLIGARPAMGKTALMGGQAVALARAGHRCAVFELEMKGRELFARFACGEGHVDAGKLRSGSFDAEEERRLLKAARDLEKLPIDIIDAPGQTLQSIRAQARALKARHPDLAAIFVDHLHIITPEAGDRRDRRDRLDQHYGAITMALKALAKELDVAVVLLVQLNRECEKRGDKRPTIPDIRECGSAEQDADCILFIYRDSFYNKEADPRSAEILCAKQRNGPTDTAHTSFIREETRFTDPEDA